MYTHITLLGVRMHKISGVVKCWGRQGLMHNDAWMKSGKVCFLKTLVRCCSLHLEPQWHVVSSLSLSFYWTFCLCFLVLQVVDCGLLAPLTPFPRGSIFALLCLALCLCVAGAGMHWLHSDDLGMNQWGYKYHYSTGYFLVWWISGLILQTLQD